ncbi:MAG: hypothetical protein U0003_02895 [Vampirovibrionales bacterium]
MAEKSIVFSVLVFTIDRVEYLSSFFDHYAYASVLEGIANLSVPKRVQYIRVICMELNRITSHLLWFERFLWI